MLFVSTMIAVVLHELAHAAAARERGYIASKIDLLPYGAVLYNEENLDKTSEIIIAAAGPLMNFALTLVAVAFWWIAPASYHYTADFVRANLIIAIFNLLPVFPLDGARVVLALSRHSTRSLKALKICGIVLSSVMFAVFVVSVFYHINITLGILAVFLFLGASSGTKKEMYAHILSSSPSAKHFEHGVTVRTLFIADTLPLTRVLKLISPRFITTFNVVNPLGNLTATLSESQMLTILTTHRLQTPLSRALPSSR